jgi:hypothetical protein
MGISRVFPAVSGIALGLATCIGMSGQTAATTKGGAAHMSIQEVHVQRVNLVTTESFDTVVARIDAQIGHPDMTAFHKSLSAAQNEADMEKVVNPVTQPNGIMEFTRFDHGSILQKEKHVVDAASYAPVTILIEERPDSVRISYDRMASYLAPYGNNDVLKVARELDAKVEKILTTAAK